MALNLSVHTLYHYFFYSAGKQASIQEHDDPAQCAELRDLQPFGRCHYLPVCLPAASLALDSPSSTPTNLV
jgi:hypothetical protein